MGRDPVGFILLGLGIVRYFGQLEHLPPTRGDDIWKRPDRAVPLRSSAGHTAQIPRTEGHAVVDVKLVAHDARPHQVQQAHLGGDHLSGGGHDQEQLRYEHLPELPGLSAHNLNLEFPSVKCHID